ncbi:MAG: PRC-barrel domain-containing protein [Candidatus Freyarchaeum deiterrae]
MGGIKISIKATEIRGKQVYTAIGKFVGTVEDLEFDTLTSVASGLHVKLKKPVENRSIISIPFSWIKAIGDIVLIRKPTDPS